MPGIQQKTTEDTGGGGTTPGSGGEAKKTCICGYSCEAWSFFCPACGNKFPSPADAEPVPGNP